MKDNTESLTDKKEREKNSDVRGVIHPTYVSKKWRGENRKRTGERETKRASEANNPEPNPTYALESRYPVPHYVLTTEDAFV